MTLKELINLPDTVDLIIPYDENLRRYIEERDYIKIGRVLLNDMAIVYVKENKIQDTLEDLGIVRVNLLPTVLTLLGKSELQASRNIASSRSTIFRFERQRCPNSDL